MAQESESEDEEQAIYNPLKLPMGWDGKPIPYWLYKLHGLGQVGHLYRLPIREFSKFSLFIELTNKLGLEFCILFFNPYYVELL